MWLEVAPDARSKDDKPRPRREQLKGNPLSKLPNPEYPHLLEWFFDFGPVEKMDNGFRPIDYKEIKAWSDLTKIELVEDEPNILHQMSVEYDNMLVKARKPSCPPPYVDGASEQSEEASMRAKVAMQFKALKNQARKA